LKRGVLFHINIFIKFHHKEIFTVKKGNFGFSKRVRGTRESRSMSASDLARLVDVTPTAVWNWENNGVVPRAETLALLATVLHVDKDWLLTGEQGSGQAAQRTVPDLSTFPLEELMAAIDRKGFNVSVSPKTP
jgi:transcriptional regulator with XRE-family HTH domain